MAFSLIFLLVTFFITVTHHIARNLFFHTLSSIPGPKAAAITTWWETWIDLFSEGGGRYFFEIERLHARHGPIVRIGPNEVHISDAAWVHNVLHGRPGSVRDKHESLAHIIGNNLGTFGTVGHHLHRQRRAAISPLFSKRAVNATQPKVRQAIDDLCNLLNRKCDANQAVELRTTLLAWSTDVLTTYMFEQPTGLLKDERKAAEWQATFEKMRQLFPILRRCLWAVPMALALPLWLVDLLLPSITPLLRVYHDMHSHATKACQADAMFSTTSTESMSDLFHTVLASRLRDDEKKEARLAHEGVEALLAGSITSPRILVRAIYHILADPLLVKRVKEEVRRIMPDSETVPELQVLVRSAYMRAVVKESLRMAQIVTARIPVVAPLNDLKYGNYDLPPGTIISYSLAYSLMDSEVFSNPKVFQPERWLASGPAHLVKMEQSFTVFGVGSRKCLGMDFALANLLTAVVVVFGRFPDMTLVDVVCERDLDHHRSWFIGEPRAESPGVQISLAPPKASRLNEDMDTRYHASKNTIVKRMVTWRSPLWPSETTVYGLDAMLRVLRLVLIMR
ncbi:hypothetical protein LTR17_001483 [Elasticomyces elasticus]|nr:hypothetical protein LTR17_001483 [Elasticomyces elasticus]